QFHKDELKQQVKTGLTQIEAASSDMPDDLLERLQGVVSRLDTDSLISIYQSLRLLDAILEANRTKSKDKASKLIKYERVKLYRQEKTIFASLNTYLESIATLSDDAEDDEEEDLADDAGLSPPSMAGDAKGAHAYATAIRALARSYYLKKSPPKSGRNAAV